MKLENIEQIVNGTCVFMPSGIQAELSMDQEGNIIVKYSDECINAYSQESFNKMIQDGIEILQPLSIEQQSVLMEDSKQQIADMNKLEQIAKTTCCPKTKQSAITLMNAAGLGVNVSKEAEKLRKAADKLEEAMKGFTGSYINSLKQIKKQNINRQLNLESYNESIRALVFPSIPNFKTLADANDFAWKYASEVGDDDLSIEVTKNPDGKFSAYLLTSKLTAPYEIRGQRLGQCIKEYLQLIGNKKLINWKSKSESIKENKITEISDEKANEVRSKRIDNFVNSKLDGKDSREEAKKLNKNSKIMANRNNKENENMSELKKLTEELTAILNEISDETVENAHTKRFQNLAKAAERKDKAEDELAAEYAKDGELDANKKAEWKDSNDEYDNAEKKFRNNIDLTLRRAINKRKHEAKMQEEFTDEMSMLTDIQDLDFPQALADTVETTEEGEVLTLGKVADEIKDMKDEIVDAVQDVKVELQAEIQNAEVAETDDIEFLDDIDDEVEELQDELADTKDELEDTQERAEEAVEEAKEEAEENEEEKPEENKEEEKDEGKMEESLINKFTKKGYFENLQQQKQEIDRAVRNGEDVEEIKNDIVLNSENKEDEEKAKEYAASKLREKLLNTTNTCKIGKLNINS